MLCFKCDKSTNRSKEQKMIKNKDKCERKQCLTSAIEPASGRTSKSGNLPC